MNDSKEETFLNQSDLVYFLLLYYGIDTLRSVVQTFEINVCVEWISIFMLLLK